jgi:outer membrane lipoprotein SlyB
VHKVLAKGASPWLLAADAAQLAATVVAHNSGLPSKHAETVGRGIGLGGSVVIGAVAGGPLGAGIAAAVWTLGETVR